MPYAAKDIPEFIECSNINPSAHILDLGGMVCEEFPGAVFGMPSKRPPQNAVLIRPLLLVFPPGERTW